MSIWFGEPSLEWANARDDTMIRAIGIEITEATEHSLKGRMPVDHRTRQPGGVLHGGASVALAETLASWGATLTVDASKFYCVGMEINANHVRPVAEGWVYGEATPLTRGRTTQVWDIRITDAAGKLVCVSRCTMAVLAKPSEY
ncbi:1,4-dihydroxy-2-naphthoyl-CoA hydrolase [Agromyces hippuratus]|uniref:1,4-dihydroxy-2-naphthoyl-CoA hydrolase n=1 Tax=Agromyces hippuratus TaxID=286438 RepID=A0A852WTN0_9MICO|nr:hotdog fold thioesterase [Agromyces hippuratus]NYG21346.1 1,4-dihydroxy-2-naphthoyl-CoA hydrolase [Agromyces hippuratus]